MLKKTAMIITILATLLAVEISYKKMFTAAGRIFVEYDRCLNGEVLREARW